jgi:uncharacterized surface protein with fasciclin (FAS1) repeats
MVSASTLRVAITHTAALRTLTELLSVAGLDGLLDEPGPFTVFAPTDEAFAALDPAELAALRADPTRLHSALSAHIIPGVLVAADLMNVLSLTTLSEVVLPVDHGAGLRVGSAYLVDADTIAGNGVLHQIDRVLPG